MKVLVTGAAGFIGSHLTEACVEDGLDVRAFVHYNSTSRWGWLDGSPVRDKIEVVSGDIRDYDSVADAVKGCEVVFHLAALIGIPYSYVSPKAYIDTNIVGTYNVLNAARQSSVGEVLVTSTSEVYGTAQFVPMTEEHPLVGQSPYSATKIGADQIALSYFRSFGLPVKVVRPFNTYGPRQSARAVIPTIISQALGGVTTLKLGNTAATRDFTFVKDTVQGFLAIFRASGLVGEVTNIGTGVEASVLDVVRAVERYTGKSIPVETSEERIRPQKSEVERLLCDNQKLLRHTSWKPRYELEKGIGETIEWMKGHLSLYKHWLYNV
jgi:dTDP-glucose 4,6-dehydratase